MEQRTLNDIYRCPYCSSIAAHGNAYCRWCGVKFNDGDLRAMEQNIRSPIGALPWNTRDRYRCLHCAELVSIGDKYCRACGDEFDAEELGVMRLNMSELARRNIPSLIGLMIFVLIVIWISIELV